MKPFSIAPSTDALTEIYPSADTVQNAVRTGTNQTKRILAQLWLTEGVPFAFRKCPALYASVRSWLACKLDVHPKEISIVGSARLGVSLSPRHVGRRFGDHSDLDFLIVCSTLFDKMCSEFGQWSEDYRSGTVKPRPNTQEEHYWKSNRNQVPTQIAKGFLDANRIPNLPSYPLKVAVADAMWRLNEKLKSTSGESTVKKATLRFYRDWDCVVRQVSVSLGSLRRD